MNPPTATPRTDDEETPLITNHRVSAETYKRMVDLAREPQTELAAARSDIDHYLRDNLTAHQMACAAGLERDQLRAEVEALKQSIESGQRVLREDAERNAARAERAEAELAARDAEYMRGGKMLAESAAGWQARAERAEGALAEWSVLNLWGGTPEIIHEFIAGQQNRIHHCQDLETELESLRAEVERLKEVSGGYYDSSKAWMARAERAEAALAAIKGTP